ncbi:MAG: NAD-dependent epimerase/dehydratase family protein [Candidatus Nanopelagicales bacterium]
MRVLVLGGTSFVGRAMADAALAAGHGVTLLNRGVTAPDRPDVETLHADRDAPTTLSVLDGRMWDAVIDVSGRSASQVSATADRLVEAVPHYLYISTVGVHSGWPEGAVDEDSPLVEADPDDPSLPDMERYSEQKRGGELAALRVIGADRMLVVRPGLILGPYENVGRVPYWLGRVAAGGGVLAPGTPDREFAYVDVRDLARWSIAAAERRLTGAFIALAPPGRDTWQDWLVACRDATGSEASFTWVDDDWLVAQGVEPWSGLPMWLPGGARPVSSERIHAEGFTDRSIDETVRDSWEWLRDIDYVPERRYRPHGIDRAREAELLAAYAARS